jgi:hypothetical protein
VAQLPAQVVDYIVLVSLFGDSLLDGGLDFGGGKIFQARLKFVSGGESEFGSELSGLGVFVGIQTVDSPELDEKLFLMTLRAVPPPPDKVHGTDVL